MKEVFRRLRVLGGSAAQRELMVAEAFEAGAGGLEERDGPPAALWIYVPESHAAGVCDALAKFMGDGVELLDDGPEPERQWSEAWKEGLEAIRVSPRLVVRPPFVEPVPGHHGLDLVIAPGQAFGTGAHASTRLALELLDELAADGRAAGRVLDVGCGSGVLALAALGLGATTALGFDLDPLASEASQEAAGVNQLADRLHLFTGGIEALGETRFDLVLANLLKRESLPILSALARVLRPGGRLVLSGLLVSERGEIEDALARNGLAAIGERRRTDPSGEPWLGLLATTL